MDQCFRIALWMCLLIGYLQAKPVCPENSTKWKGVKFYETDLAFDLLVEEVKCGPNVNFTTPRNVQELCYTAALESFIKGLEEAENVCQDSDERIADARDAIENSYPNKTECPLPAQCKWESSRMDFNNFVTHLETFVKQLNSFSSQ